MPGREFAEGASAGEPRPAEAEPERETRWTNLPWSTAPALPPSVKVQAYIRMFLLSELASPVGKATGMRDEKDTWWESWRRERVSKQASDSLVNLKQHSYQCGNENDSSLLERKLILHELLPT